MEERFYMHVTKTWTAIARMRFPVYYLSSAVRARKPVSWVLVKNCDIAVPMYYKFKQVEVEETCYQEVSSFFDVESF